MTTHPDQAQNPIFAMDPYNLQRFVDAQRPIYPQVLAELRAGQKETHWMWFVFPQLKGLGTSPTAHKFAIGSLDEARAFLDHPTLGPRLRDCTRLVTTLEGRSVADIFGYPDHLKFHSSMTLFAHATPDNHDFTEALRKYFHSDFDSNTMQRLRPHHLD